MTPEQLQALTWTVARAGGFVALALLTVSVAIGLVLSLKWRSPRYTRFVTTELHRFVTLLSLVFIAVHGLAIAVDPYIAFSLKELFVPLASHYRPVWVALGITSAYLALAVYLSERIRGRIGYAWWHRLHLLAFVVWGASLLHGLGAGSDSRTTWALALYAASALVVGGLLLLRLRPVPAPAARPATPARPGATVPSAVVVGPIRTAGGAAVVVAVPRPAPSRDRRRRPSLKPLLIVPVAAAVITSAAWAATGPLAPGWNDAAGGTTAQAATPAPSPSPTVEPVQPIGLPFDATLTGTVDQVGGAQGHILLTADFTGDAVGRLELQIPLGPDGEAPLTLTVEPTGAVCTGSLQYAQEGQIGGQCTLASGRTLAVAMRVGLDSSGGLVGDMEVSAAA